jgi:hypothetical protein
MQLEFESKRQHVARDRVRQPAPPRTRQGGGEWRRVLIAAALSVAACAHAVAAAQAVGANPEPALPTAALLSTAGARAGERALDSALQDAVRSLGMLRLKLEPQLDLPAEQLAVGCDGETPRCLRAIALQSNVQILIAPVLRHDAQGLVLETFAFDTRAAGTLRRVTRTQTGQVLTLRLIDQVPGALRELFGVEAAAAQPRSTSNAVAGSPQEAETRATVARKPAGKFPLAPALLAGSGALLIAGGATAGLIMQHTQHDYTRSMVLTESDADSSASQAAAGKRQAAVANVLFGVGGAAVVAGAIWLAVTLMDDHEQRPQTAILPTLGRGQLGIALIQRSDSL